MSPFEGSIVHAVRSKTCCPHLLTENKSLFPEPLARKEILDKA